MKKILLLSACLISLHLSAQGNLQFNRVINHTISGTVGLFATIGSVTVPAGKVWKLESANFTFTNAGRNTALSSPAMVAYIGDNLIWDGNNSDGTKSLFPIWLPAGTFEVKASSSNAWSMFININAIEFNVIP